MAGKQRSKPAVGPRGAAAAHLTGRKPKLLMPWGAMASTSSCVHELMVARNSL